MATFFKYDSSNMGDLRHEYIDGLKHLGSANGEEYYSMIGEIVVFPTQSFTVTEVTVADVKLVVDSLAIIKSFESECSRKIRDIYSVDAEFKALRTNDLAYVAHVEACITEFKAKKAELGII